MSSIIKGKMSEKNTNFLDVSKKEEDKVLDLTLRPKTLKEYAGQEKIKESLRIFMEAAKKRHEPMEHLLFYGPPGLGKTTLAHIIARETGVGIRITSGPAIERVGDLGSILTSLNNLDILFIDEIHRLNRTIEEILYPAMEEYVLDIVIGKGPSAKILRLDLPKITLIGATTRLSGLSSPLRDRFGMTHRLDFYSEDEIAQILRRSSKILGLDIDENGINMVACCSRRTPRVANRLLKRVRDFAEVKVKGKINKKVAESALEMLEVDPLGLDSTDRHLLEILIDKFEGGPVGLKTLAAATQDEEETIAEVSEPFLLQLGFLKRTPRGREATKAAYKHLGREYSKTDQKSLL